MGISDLTPPTLPYRMQLCGLLVLDMSAKPWGDTHRLESPGHRDKHREGCGCWEDVGYDEVHKDVTERRYDGWEVVACVDGSQEEGKYRCGRVTGKVELFSSTY